MGRLIFERVFVDRDDGAHDEYKTKCSIDLTHVTEWEEYPYKDFFKTFKGPKTYVWVNNRLYILYISFERFNKIMLGRNYFTVDCMDIPISLN